MTDQQQVWLTWMLRMPQPLLQLRLVTMSECGWLLAPIAKNYHCPL
jgi:hypothetical protein